MRVKMGATRDGRLTAADGLTIPAARQGQTQPVSKPWVTVDLWVDVELPERTVVVLGCDPVLALLGAHVTRRYPAYRLIWVESSSLAALRLLGCGEAHAAGTHLWDPDTGEYNVPYVRRELSGRRLVIVTLSDWQRGLIVARGDPRGISGPAELARPDITMVSRPFQEERAALGGYDSSGAGMVVAELAS
jgi:putative molybdopterin biosynthesis protein